MLLTVEEMKLMKPIGNDLFEAKDDLTPEQKKELKELDEWHFDMYGKHLITNYKDL